MNDTYKIKLSFIKGLKEIVLKEIAEKTNFQVLDVQDECVYLIFDVNFQKLLILRSVNYISLVIDNKNLNPLYLSNRKSILKDMIDIVLNKKLDKFSKFKISCAGSISPEVRSIVRYIEQEYKMTENVDADLKIAIAKIGDEWEVSVQISKRPISVRNYKVGNMAGAMDPTVAFALNEYCELKDKKTYLNAFSGSGTLLIEAGLAYHNLENMIGFDNNKKHLSLSYRNINQAGLIKRINLKEENIYNQPDLGKFDVIVADLPFGMVISKSEDLGNLYKSFLEYSMKFLNQDGVLGVYTSEHKLFKSVMDFSKWEIVKEVELKLVTSVDSYLYPKIMILKKKG
ncbi:MAG: methyltransferase [Candidatus Nomurabacteria bacterium]